HNVVTLNLDVSKTCRRYCFNSDNFMITLIWVEVDLSLMYRTIDCIDFYYEGLLKRCNLSLRTLLIIITNVLVPVVLKVMLAICLLMCTLTNTDMPLFRYPRLVDPSQLRVILKQVKCDFL
ncbi:hypothetical protein ACJX0J_024805, partial [Zea mays]